MSRIRTIKPGFFKHEGLFDAEAETGLPLRVAFAGLWTQCDREGRFAWRPRQLKTDVLPYDDVDFSRVLDALATRGFVVRYASDGEEYGYIPSWRRHQVINNREAASQIPTPPENIDETDASATRAARVTEDAKGKGKEGEGKGREKNPPAAAKEYVFVGNVGRVDQRQFDKWRESFAYIPDLLAELQNCDDYYTANPLDDPKKWFWYFSKWLGRANEAARAKNGPTDWRKQPEYRGMLDPRMTAEELAYAKAHGLS